MTSSISSNPLGYTGINFTQNPPIILAQRAPTSNDIYNIGTQWADQSVNPTELYETIGNGVWQVANSALLSLTGSSGGAVLPTNGNINIVAGAGLTSVGNPGTSTITLTSTAVGLPYSTVTADTGMQQNNGYITNKAGTAAVMTLPATAAVGSLISVVGRGATGWSVGQLAGQVIHMNSVSTTVGTGGSLASSAQYNSVMLLCIVANTEFTVISSQGILTVT